MDWNLITAVLVAVGTSIGTVGSLTWWLSGQFRSTRDLVYTQIQQVLEKLEYHEKHDDSRFLGIRNDIWEIRLRNATIDGKQLKHKEVNNERRDQNRRTEEGRVS
jgi:hypothetical protein